MGEEPSRLLTPPPWWKRGPAILVYVIVLVAVVWALFIVFAKV